jgi:hypothetical protein
MWRHLVLFSRKNSNKCLVTLAAILVFSVSTGGSETLPSGIQVELDSHEPLLLHVTLWSHAGNRLTLAKWRLPWGNRNSILFVPVNHVGECIDNKYFAEEYPNYEKVSIDPNGSITGEINLQRVVPGLDKAVKKSNVHLFWAYEAPEELHIARWSGGWILIPQQK